MKSVIILAAGRGTRLAPLTDRLPKALVPVAGRPILDYAIAPLVEERQAGECEIVIVVGHEGEQIARYANAMFGPVRIVWNHHYQQTNNMMSLYLGLSAAHPDASVVFMNGDCVYDPDIIKAAFHASRPSVFCDPAMRHNPESMKISVMDGRVSAISKTLTAEESYAVSCDLYALAGTAPQLRQIAFEYLASADLNQWSEVALNEVMQRGLIDFTPASVGSAFWHEIDNHEDLAIAVAKASASVPKPA